MSSKIALSIALVGTLSSFPALGDTFDDLQTRLIQLKEYIQIMRQKDTAISSELELNQLDNKLNELQDILDRNANKKTPTVDKDTKSTK